LWAVDRGITVRRLRKHTAAVRVVAFSPDGRHLATAAEDRSLRLWDATEGREYVPAIPLPDCATALCFARTGPSLIVGTLGGFLLNIDPANGQLRQFVGVEPGPCAVRPVHADSVSAILLSTTSGTLYSVCQDHTVFAWTPAESPDEAPLEYRATGGQVTSLALSPDGRTLATGIQDGTICLSDAATATVTKTLTGHQGAVTAVIFAGSGRLISAGMDEQIRIWDLNSGKAVHTIVEPSATFRIALSPDGSTLAVAGGGLAGITLLDVEDGEMLRHFGAAAGSATAIAFTPGGDRLGAGYADGTVRLWDAVSGIEVQRGPAGREQVDIIAFGPDGLTAAVALNRVASFEAEVQSRPVHAVVLWDVRSGSVPDDSRALIHSGPVTAVAFAPGSDQVLTGARDGNMYIWELKTGRVTNTIRSHADVVRAVVLASDGTAVFSAGDRTARRWPLPASVHLAPSSASVEARP
jgi:WD40 repeat protein